MSVAVERRGGDPMAALARAHAALDELQHLDWTGSSDETLLEVLLTVLDSVHGITRYSSTRRLFTENERLALIARDGGCTFPDCPMPPAWCGPPTKTQIQQPAPTRRPALSW